MTITLPSPLGDRAEEIYFRVMDRATRSGGCLLWDGKPCKVGYARVHISTNGTRAILYAHRVVWEYANGPIPEGHLVVHTCGHKTCIDVSHLELITRSENGRRQGSRSQFVSSRQH